MVLGTQEPTIPLQLEKIWGLDSAKVGLVFLAAVVPTVVCKSRQLGFLNSPSNLGSSFRNIWLFDR